MTTPTIEAANTYHSLRLGKEKWEAQSPERRARALLSASETLVKYEASSDYARACFEQALWILGDEAEMALIGVTSIGLDGLSKGYNRTSKCPPGIAPMAWDILATSASGSGGGVKCGQIRSVQSCPSYPPF